MNCLIGAKTYFSAGESVLSPKALLDEAHKLGYTHVAICDTNNVNALPTVFPHAKELGIEIVIGASVNVVDSLAWRKPKKDEKKTRNPFFKPNIYIRNQKGFEDLMFLLTKANDEDHFYMQPQILFEELLEVYERGNVVVTSGTIDSMLTHKSYEMMLAALNACDSERLFIDSLALETAYGKRINEIAGEICGKEDYSAIVSNPVLHAEGDRELRDVVNCVMKNSSLNAVWANRIPDGYHMQSIEEQESFIDLLGEVFDLFAIDDNAERFFDLFDYEWSTMDVSLPVIEKDPLHAIKVICKQGFRERLIEKATLGYKPDASQMRAYKERLEYELGVLKHMGFEGYFVLVHYIVNWCKANKIEVGPGRGSVGGSLVAYLMGITDVDPIRFGLIFERFINPDRLDLPDIDLDFMSSRREEVVHHLVDHFGEEYVAGISNYSMLGPPSALRSVAKVYDVPEDEYSCSKFIPKTHGTPAPLEEAVSMVPELEKFATERGFVWEQAIKAQNMFRSYSQHAAGVIVGGVPLQTRAVVERRKGGSVVNWDKRTVEEFGFVKLDILGLATLDVLSVAKEKVRKHYHKEIDLNQIPLDDERVLDMFRKGKSVGVFQFDGGGMRSLLKKLGEVDPLSFDDISAATALFRPGPIDSGLMEKFTNIKQGSEMPSYMHENMEAALEETYGVIVYQEQVMQLARDLAGFTMAESDHLRKAMGKKDPAKMALMRDQWVKGCESHSDMDAASAETLFDQIESFAGYAFNKSHSVEYSIISYWAMYFKTYYPEVFYASVMTVQPDKKIAKECVESGIAILPPDINKSSGVFEIDYQTRGAVLYTPFKSIKGVSEKATNAILKAREEGDFASKEDFIDRVDRRSANIRVQGALDKVGAFAEIEDGQLPATHHDRLKDQKELIPDATVGSVKADRKIEINSVVTDKLITLVEECESCSKCTLAGTPHPTPRLGKSAKVMVIMDCPNWSEVDKMKMGEGEAAKPLREALKQNGLSMKDVYITSLVKAAKPKGESLANEMINGCSEYLKREIELLKPAAILTLGGQASRAILPELKGSWEELCGQEHYLAAKDTTVVVGMNPMMIHFDSAKQENLNQAVKQIAELIT